MEAPEKKMKYILAVCVVVGQNIGEGGGVLVPKFKTNKARDEQRRAGRVGRYRRNGVKETAWDKFCGFYIGLTPKSCMDFLILFYCDYGSSSVGSVIVYEGRVLRSEDVWILFYLTLLLP